MSGSVHDAYMKQVFQFDVAARSKTAGPGGTGGDISGHHKAAGPAKPHKLTTEERLSKDEDRIRGNTKSIIGLKGAQLLQRQYDDMIVGLERAKAARLADIAGWKPEKAPLAGNLLLGICKGLASVATKAFPEIKFLEIAAKGIDIAVSVKGKADHKTEASKDDLEAVKKAATNELNTLIGEARVQASKREDAFQKMIEAEVEKLTPEQIDALEGMTEPKLVGDFVRDKLGIKRGEDHSPGIVGLMELQIMTEFNAWVKKDFKRRKTGESSHDVASDGGHSWEAMSLADLYRMQEAGDTRGLQISLDALNASRENNTPPIPEGWYEKQLKKLTEKIEGDYAEEFATDIDRLILERPA